MSESEQKKWSSPPEGSPCWIEIPARDLEKLKEFYSALFPSWEFNPQVNTDKQTGTKTYMYTFKRPEKFGGGLVQMPAECGINDQKMGSGYTVYYFVDSIDKTSARITELGGSIVMEKTPESENGWFANAKDTEGNRFGIYELHPKMKA